MLIKPETLAEKCTDAVFTTLQRINGGIPDVKTREACIKAVELCLINLMIKRES